MKEALLWLAHIHWCRDVSIAVVLLAAILISSASYLHTAHRLPPYNTVNDANYRLHFVEADDDGWFWNRKQADDALASVQQSASEMDTFVLLFVHGWHHSASCCDDNVEGFKETLDRLRVELEKPNFAAARNYIRSPASSQFRIIGIYLGWRGGSLPWPLDYFTFWGRKSAAERVGRGDAREFLAHLNHAFLEHKGRAVERPKPPYLGLITIGHSFGGDAVLRAVSATLEDELEQVNPKPAYLRDSKPTDPPLNAPAPVTGFGDIAILINPAVEASAYQRLHVLAQGLRFDGLQHPIMLTVSADNDKARKKLFSLGRIFGEWFTRKPTKADSMQREMERQPLGVYGEAGVQITHRLEPVDPSVQLVESDLRHTAEEGCKKKGQDCVCKWFEWKDQPKAFAADTAPYGGIAALADPRMAVRNLIAYDFSQDQQYAGVNFKRLKGGMPYQPLIVATASPQIIDGHIGIFTGPFVNFLVRYVGYIEAKQYLATML